MQTFRGSRWLLVAGSCAGVLVNSSIGVVAASVPGAPGCPMLPANSVWHAPIASLPVHPMSGTWTAAMSAGTKNLHADFGAYPYGEPYIVVDAVHPKVTPQFYYSAISDSAPPGAAPGFPSGYPFDAQTPIQAGHDHHAFMVDRDNCYLYELFLAQWNNGAPTAGSGAIFDLRSNALRPDGRGSANAAGIAMMPGLVRFDEVQSGVIDHALVMTAAHTDRSHIWPARSDAGEAFNHALPPMGARFRLRASFDTSHFSPSAQVVLTALKRYGALLDDNGGPGGDWFFQGTQDPRWTSNFLTEFRNVPASAMEVVDEQSLMIDPNSGVVAGAAPSAPTPAPVAVAPTLAPAPTATSTSTATPNAAVHAAAPGCAKP